MKNILCKIVVLVFAILCYQTADCQLSNFSFSNYSTKDGLSSATVYNIIKDRFGFIWLATEDGVSRFDGTNFVEYRHDPGNPNGLRVNHITALYESVDGTIWIGTNGGGLSYYDRNKDSIYNYHGNDPIQIGSAITAINGDKEGNIWIASFGGLYVVNPIKKEMVSGKFDLLRKAVAGMVVTYFLQDKMERLWVGTDNGMYLYEPVKKNITCLKHQKNDSTSLPGNGINNIVEDENRIIWVGTDKGLAKLLPDGRSFSTYSATEGFPRLSGGFINALGVDARNRLWIGTNEGLDIFDISTNKVSNYQPDKRNTASISSRSIRSVFIDRKGAYWIGTFRGGVNKYDENFNYFNLKEYNAFDPFGLRSSIVTSFAASQYGVFVGTNDGGLQLYNQSTGLLTYVNLSGKTGNHDLSILTLEMSADQQLWIGTFSNGLYRYNPATGAHVNYLKGPMASQLNNNEVFCLKEDTKGNMWVGTNGGGINVISPGGGPIVKYVFDGSRTNDPARPTSNFIRSFEEDSIGRMWVGTFGAGISVFNPDSKQFSFYTKQNSGLPSDYVMAIKQDKKGNFWVGTSGNGIGLLKKGSTKFESMTEKDGLANGHIHKIIEDATGKIWVSTNKGVSCFDPGSGKFKNYTSSNGLQSGAFVPRAGTKTPAGELYFGGQNGFNHFNPADFKTNRNIPPVVFTSLVIDNQLVHPSSNGPISQSILLAKEINIRYKQAFSIGFEALDFTVSQANQYEYRLQGFDKTWVTPGKEHSAYYANIPPGSYLFQVRASNNDGIWNNQGRSIQVIVAPPLWRSYYAYVVYLLLALGVLFYIRHRNIKEIHMRVALEQERQRSNQLIERERKEAEYMRKLDKVKIKFLTNLSHEFRTPISLIMGPVDNLIRNIKDEGFVIQLNLIKRNSRRLLNLVNQLLDFRKMEERELKLQCSEGDIVLFIKDVCDSFNELAKRKQTVFSFYSGIKGANVLFDQDKVERILFNILSNAFKFTPENGNISVIVAESRHVSAPGSSSITVSISDSGIGIPKEYQPHIFESFFQHETSAETLNHGTGIGLSITREFVQLHGGKVSVESEPGQGSTFTFNLVLKNVEAATGVVNDAIIDEPQEGLIQLSSPNPIMPSVLIVEDDDDFRLYIKENLKTSYQVFEAPNGKEGWQRSLFHHPDIIVCDVQMPVMNGLELIQKLKSDKRTRHIPLILLTAANTPTGALDGLESGAIDYITKPFDFALLQAKMHNILGLNNALKENTSRKVTVILPETETVSIKEKFLQKALSYIYTNLSDSQLSVESLSSHMCVSRASLYNRLLEYTGMTPVDFIRSVKLEKAKELLQKSDLNIAAIAYETGFSNPNYFTKVFKTCYKITPSEFVAENRKG